MASGCRKVVGYFVVDGSPREEGEGAQLRAGGNKVGRLREETPYLGYSHDRCGHTYPTLGLECVPYKDDRWILYFSDNAGLLSVHIHTYHAPSIFSIFDWHTITRLRLEPAATMPSLTTMPLYADTVGPNVVDDIETAMKARYTTVQHPGTPHKNKTPRFGTFYIRSPVSSTCYLPTSQSAQFELTSVADLSGLVAKAQALGAQLLAARNSARRPTSTLFQKDNSSFASSSSSYSSSSSVAALKPARARLLRRPTLAVTAKLVTTARLEPYDSSDSICCLPSPSSPSSSSSSSASTPFSTSASASFPRGPRPVALLPPQAPPRGALIRAENWADMMHDSVVLIRRRERRARMGRQDSGLRTRTDSALGHARSSRGRSRESVDQERAQRRLSGQKSCHNNKWRQEFGCKEQLPSHKGLFARHFQSLDRALSALDGDRAGHAWAGPPSAANHGNLGPTTGRWFVILERVKEEEEEEEAFSMSEGTLSGATWEDPATDIMTLAEDDFGPDCCCCCQQSQARKEEY